MATATTDATFKNDVLEAQQPVLVDFWAPWCGPCRMVGPIIDAVGSSFNGKAQVFKLNVDENPATAASYGITSIPTVIVFNQGKQVQQFVGVQQETVYTRALSELTG